MIIPFIGDYLEKRAMVFSTSELIKKLEDGAKEAVINGEIEKSIYLQGEADRLRLQLKEQNDRKVSDTKIITAGQKYQQRKPVDPAILKLQWAALGADKVTSTAQMTIFDCGERGMVIITPNRVRVRGFRDDPLANLLATRHVQLHFDGECIHRGSPESKFKAAVAGKMLGVKVINAHIPRSRRQEAVVLTQQWQPILENIIPMNSPKRPLLRDDPRRTPQVAVAAA